MFFFELPPQFKHVLRYILYLLYVHSLIHRFHNEREDEEGEGGGRQRKADIKYTLFFMSAKLLLILNAGKQTRLEAFHHGLEISNAGKKFI